MRWIPNSTKALLRKVATSILPALLGVGAIYLILSNGFTRRTVESSKGSPDIHAAPVTKDAQDAGGDNDRTSTTSGPAKQDTAEDPHGAAFANSSPTQTPAPGPNPALTPAPVPKAFATDSEFLANQQPTPATQPSPLPTPQSALATQQPAGDLNKSEKQPGETKRKRLEKKRLAAERNRARLEKMYQNHRISSDAYKKGEEKYKSEIEEYRSAVNAGRAPKNDS
jgi:hypothetical protein